MKSHKALIDVHPCDRLARDGCVTFAAKTKGQFGFKNRSTALSTHRLPRPAEELFNTANKTTADGLASLPKDYTGIPQLGPPLPGDLGRPILNANAALPPASGLDTAERRMAQESEAVRTRHAFTYRLRRA